MKNKKRITLLFFAAIIIVPLAIFGAVNWYRHNVSGLPHYGQKYSIEESAPYFKVPAFSFINQNGSQLNQSFVNNKVWIANFFFTSCPSICPTMMHNIQKIQAAFTGNDNVRMISFTVDPERDSSARLNRYAQQYGINAQQWQLATGAKKDLYRFARKGLFVVATDGDGDAEDFIHSDNIVLIDKSGSIRGYYDGTSNSDMNKLIADIKTLL